ncbi:hypothetical protein EV193_103617 [Herbihabitans rhizosphaerae]|uniref:PE family protein n=1 Tax=Herbihabitans rhizosphaerae TaxID=1872711 RepID=A0A4Q7KX51_9PSEU|nr:hypothetical protein [Herbihabitans rhizosphaerae]RZS41295.1 hypothetical protein EV193_103617 [Herbihabitans rhizosphaerae]
MAHGGDLEIAPEAGGGRALLAAVDHCIDVLDKYRRQLRNLEYGLALGSSDGARVVAPLMTSAAIDEQGLRPQMGKAAQELLAYRQAVEAAMRSYEATEGKIRSDMNRADS